MQLCKPPHRIFFFFYCKSTVLILTIYYPRVSEMLMVVLIYPERKNRPVAVFPHVETITYSVT